MVWQRDVDLVVPLWQGGDDMRVAPGAAALARLIPTGGSRLHISVTDGPRTTVDGILNLDIVADTQRQLRDRLTRRDPRRTLTLGGDCTSDLAAVQHLAARHPGMTCYWVDAHPDLNTPATSPSGRAHGMPLRALLGEGHPRMTGDHTAALSPTAVTLLATRDFDPAELDYVRTNRITHIGPDALAADPTAATTGRPPGGPAYIHLDIDACDPADLPAVACPTPGGPTAPALAATLRALHDHHDVVGIGICEYAPVIEHTPQRVQALLDALALTAPAPTA